MAYYGDLEGILTGLTKSTDHPSMVQTYSLQSSIPQVCLWVGKIPSSASVEATYHFFTEVLRVKPVMSATDWHQIQFNQAYGAQGGS